MLKEIIISFQAYLEAHKFIKKHQLWRWILIPGIVYSVMLIIGFYFFMSSYNEATQWMFEELHLNKWMEKFQDSWLSFFFIIGKIFIDLLLLFAYFSFFKFFFLLFASPVFAYLSEKTEHLLHDNYYHFDFLQLLNDIFRAIVVSLKNTSWQFIYMLGLLIVSFIPLVGWISPLVFLFIDCYFLGFSMLDYSNARQELSSSQSIDFISHHRGLAIGNGMIFYCFHLIPVIGWIFAPSYAVVAATLSLHQSKEKKIYYN